MTHGLAVHSQRCRLPCDWDGGPQGVWAEWGWDCAELVVRNDRLGFSPLCWFGTDDCIGVSPSLAALGPHLDHRELDDDAFAVFLRFRSFIGGGTHRFKLQWEGREEPLHWYQWAPEGAGEAATPSPDQGAWAWGPRIWKRLPLGLATALGPRVVRGIP